MDGLHAYEYRGVVEPTVLGQLDIPGSIIGRDEPTVTVDRVTSSETSYLVEPETGVIISATSKQDSYATLDGEKVITITNGTFTTPDDAADETVDTYRPLATALYRPPSSCSLVGRPPASVSSCSRTAPCWSASSAPARPRARRARSTLTRMPSSPMSAETTAQACRPAEQTARRPPARSASWRCSPWPTS